MARAGIGVGSVSSGEWWKVSVGLGVEREVVVARQEMRERWWLVEAGVEATERVSSNPRMAQLRSDPSLANQPTSLFQRAGWAIGFSWPEQPTTTTASTLTSDFPLLSSFSPPAPKTAAASSRKATPISGNAASATTPLPLPLPTRAFACLLTSVQLQCSTCRANR